MPQLDEAAILQLLQDGAAGDWAGLVRATEGWGLPPGNLPASEAQAFFLRKHLDALRDAGLVTYRRQTSESWPAIAGPITLNPAWHDMADGLGGHSPTKLHEPSDPRSLLVRPFFGQPCDCLLYTSPSPRDRQKSRMPSSA